MLPYRVAIVTGANRGLGFEICRQLAKQEFFVVLTSRSLIKGKKAAYTLKQEGLNVVVFKLDVTKSKDIENFTKFIYEELGRADVLINNAGILLEPGAPININTASVFKTKLDIIRQSMETNVYGPLRICQSLVPIMKKNNYGRIVNVSSGMGQLEVMKGGWPGYRISKVSLNALTRILADELKGYNILVNSVCPRWVQTDMGGPNAPVSQGEAVKAIIWLAMLPDNGPSGSFSRDQIQIPW